jgi:hypothetical protein
MHRFIPLALLASLANAPTSGHVGAGDDIAPKMPMQLTGVDKWLLAGPDYSGFVTEVTGQTIAIAHRGTEIQLYNAAGQKIGGEIIPPQPPRTFLAGNVFADGGYCKELHAQCSYRWSDVKVGDRVTIRFERAGDALQCTAIQIERRPGGRVPPAQLKVPDPFHQNLPQWHEQCNAHQDLEEKGTPLPEKYRPKLPPRLLSPAVEPTRIPPAKP